MPQLDISAWPPQLFWLAISFALLYFVVSKLIIPRTGGVIELRKSTIEGDLAAATRNKAESEAALKAYEASLAEARTKAGAEALQIRNALHAETESARNKLDADLSAKAADADKKITTAKNKALAGVEAMASDIASSIVDQLAGTKVTKTASAAAVAKAAK
jgi:F-type H+-transporting ATPase subunit b